MSCPTLPSNGTLSSSAGAATWIAPVNRTSTVQTCTIDAIVSCAQGLSTRVSIDTRFGILVESLPTGAGAMVAPLVVERSIYCAASGVAWGAGTSAVATKLR